jgi:hypothetical protein
MLRPASASLSQPQPLGPRFRSTGHIGLVFDILRKLFALEKQSPLGAYLSAAELGRRVYSCVHVHGVCMTCACRVHGTCIGVAMAFAWCVHGVRRLARLCSIVRFGEGRSIRNDSPFYLVLDGCVTCVAVDDEQAAL